MHLKPVDCGLETDTPHEWNDNLDWQPGTELNHRMTKLDARKYQVATVKIKQALIAIVIMLHFFHLVVENGINKKLTCIIPLNKLWS